MATWCALLCVQLGTEGSVKTQAALVLAARLGPALPSRGLRARQRERERCEQHGCQQLPQQQQHAAQQHSGIS